MGHVSVLIGVLSNIAVRRTERLHSDWFDRRTTLACKTPFVVMTWTTAITEWKGAPVVTVMYTMTGEEELRAYH